MAITTCIFDAYGTLFDVTAAARAAAEEPWPERFAANWERIAADWRSKQLEYTWLRAVAGQHCDFWQVTQDGLDWALDAARIESPDLRKRLLNLYWDLAAYPEVLDMLTALKAAGLSTGILSNGSPAMLQGAVNSAGIEHLLDAVLSVEQVGIFKPHPSVYDLVAERFECAKGEVLFVSSNGWDVCAAAGYGFRTAWVNRSGAPVDRLWGAPDTVLNDLTTIMDIAR